MLKDLKRKATQRTGLGALRIVSPLQYPLNPDWLERGGRIDQWTGNGKRTKIGTENGSKETTIKTGIDEEAHIKTESPTGDEGWTTGTEERGEIGTWVEKATEKEREMVTGTGIEKESGARVRKETKHETKNYEDIPMTAVK